MPRGIPLDLNAVERIDTVDILPSPPPAYSKLPDPEPDSLVDRAETSTQNDDDEEEEEDSWDEDEGDEEYDEDEDHQESGIDRQLVNDQDWENASGDLTKRYNRLRQHVGALNGEQVRQGGAGAITGNRRDNGRMSLPAQNQFSQHQKRNAVVANTNALGASAANGPSSASNNDSSTTGVHASKMESSLAALSHKYASALNLAPIASTSATSGGYGNAYSEPSFTSNAATRKGGSERHNVTKDKSDRATTEQVLDPRTRLVLFKMLGRGLLEVVEGCVSTGKEANVYHALGRIHPDTEPPSPQVHLAIKIYKTSILTFKARSKYLTGEFRFKNGYSKVKNPRKMVRLWAEKEMRNLKRLHSAGIRCPEPVEVRGNVLVMTFLGKDEDGWEASPRLKDAEIPADKMQALYIEMLTILRKIFKVCRLVHADLSEYNVLYNVTDGHLYIIDVSQSVEEDHPQAFDFLRSDIGNVDEFFARRGVRTLGMKRTFGLTVEDWGKNGEETEEEIAQEMERRFEVAEENKEDEEKTEEADRVFKQAYIPRNLNEVYDAERDVQAIMRGEKDQLIYSQTVGVVAPKQEVLKGDEEESDSDSASGSEEGDETSDDDEDEEGRPRVPRGKRHEDKDSKRERKQAVKEEKREKRKEKIPKSVKKAKVKKTSGKNRK